jgi:hypothetical protein
MSLDHMCSVHMDSVLDPLQARKVGHLSNANTVTYALD